MCRSLSDTFHAAVFTTFNSKLQGGRHLVEKSVWAGMVMYQLTKPELMGRVATTSATPGPPVAQPCAFGFAKPVILRRAILMGTSRRRRHARQLKQS